MFRNLLLLFGSLPALAQKSTDSGATWRFAGLKDAGQIASVIVHPGNPDLVFAADRRGRDWRPVSIR